MDELCVFCSSNLWENKGIKEMFVAKDNLCGHCRKKFSKCGESYTWNGIKIYIEYHYDDFLASLIFQFKSGDSKLSSTLFYQANKKIKTYRKYVYVLPPSTKHTTLKRGYIPLELALSNYGIRVLHPFIKLDNYEQKSSSKRAALFKHITLVDKLDPSSKYLLIDDVATSGTTLKACIHLMRAQGVDRIEVYLLSATSSFIQMLKSEKEQITQAKTEV